MKISRLVIYVIILAAVMAYIFLVEHGYKQDRQLAETQAARFIPGDRDKISSITIISNAKGAVELVKPASDWMITEPLKTMGDANVIRTLLATLVEAAPEKTVIEKEVKWSEYGFDNPVLVVKVTMDQNRHYEIVIGAQNPSMTSYYMRLSEDPRLFLVADTLKNALDKSLFDLRDKTIMSFAPSDIDRVIISRNGVQNEFRREGVGQWKMTSPEQFKVKNVAISTLLRKLSNLTAIDILDEKKTDLEQYGLQKPTETISVFGKDISQTLYVGGHTKPEPDSTDKKGDYVRVDDSKNVYVIDDPSITDFKIDPDSLQDRSIVSITPSEVDRIEVSITGRNWILSKSHEKKWHLEQPEKIGPLKDWNITGILWKLRDLNYVSLLTPIPDSLDDLGLTKPKVEIRLNAQGVTNFKSIKIGWPEIKQNLKTGEESTATSGEPKDQPEPVVPETQADFDVPPTVNVLVEPSDYPNTVFRVDGSFLKWLSEDLETLTIKQQ